MTTCHPVEPAWGPWLLAGAIACTVVGAAFLIHEFRKPFWRA